MESDEPLNMIYYEQKCWYIMFLHVEYATKMLSRIIWDVDGNM